MNRIVEQTLASFGNQEDEVPCCKLSGCTNMRSGTDNDFLSLITCGQHAHSVCLNHVIPSPDEQESLNVLYKHMRGKTGCLKIPNLLAKVCLAFFLLRHFSYTDDEREKMIFDISRRDVFDCFMCRSLGLTSDASCTFEHLELMLADQNVTAPQLTFTPSTSLDTLSNREHRRKKRPSSDFESEHTIENNSALESELHHFKEFCKGSDILTPSLHDGRVAVASSLSSASAQRTYLSKGQQQYNAAMAHSNTARPDLFIRGGSQTKAPPHGRAFQVTKFVSQDQLDSQAQLLQLPEIAALMCRLVDAKLGFTQDIVMDVLSTDDCWNATSFIHALRARETGRRMDMLESMRTSIDASMDMIIVDLTSLLINEYKFNRDDVLDAIGTFRCHNAEDAVNLMEQAQLRRECLTETYQQDLLDDIARANNANSSASSSSSFSNSSASASAPETSSASSFSTSNPVEDPALLPYNPSQGSYTDYLRAKNEALKRRLVDTRVTAVGSDATSIARGFMRPSLALLQPQILNHALPTVREAENMSCDQILFYLKKHDLLSADELQNAESGELSLRLLRERLQEHIAIMDSVSDE